MKMIKQWNRNPEHLQALSLGERQISIGSDTVTYTAGAWDRDNIHRLEMSTAEKWRRKDWICVAASLQNLFELKTALNPSSSHLLCR